MSPAQKWILMASGIFTAYAAYRIANSNARRPIPVKLAAEKLKKAWANHHTYA